MAFGDVANTATASSTGVVAGITTTAISVTSGDLLIASISARTGSAVNFAFTDSSSGIWTPLTNGSTNSPQLWGAYQYITTASTNLTITAACSVAIAGGKVLIASEFIGPFSSSPLDTNPAAVRFTTSTAISNPTGGLSTSGELLYSYVNTNANSTSYASSAPFNLITAVGVGGGAVTNSQATASFVATSTNSDTAVWTPPAAAGYVCIASFKPVPGVVFQWYPMDDIGLANERLIRPGYEVNGYDA